MDSATGHKRFGRTRRVQPASQQVQQQTQPRSLAQLFASSSVLKEHLVKFEHAGIDGHLVLELDKSDLAEILGVDVSIGDRMRVHRALQALRTPPPPEPGHEDEKLVRMLSEGCYHRPEVQHLTSILDTNQIVAALFMTIAASALIAPPTACVGDVSVQACETLMTVETIGWTFSFAFLFASVIGCSACGLLIPALLPEEVSDWLQDHWKLVLTYNIYLEIGGSVCMFVGMVPRAWIQAPRRGVAIVATGAFVVSFLSYLIHCHVLAAAVFRCKASLKPHSSMQRILTQNLRVPKRD
jgi:hypothetical protein